MKIKSVDIQRFTAFERVQLDFSSGLNVFIGANATGKSHLLKLLYAPFKAVEELRPRSKKIRHEDLELEVRKKLDAVFMPQDSKTRRLVRRGQGRNHAAVRIETSTGAVSFELTTQGRLSLADNADIPRPNGCLFLPSREFLSAYEGFIAAYRSRELSFDETYYDLCLALSAKPLRGPRGEKAKRLLEPLRKALPFKIVLENNRFYITAPGQGKIEAHLVAEGYRKLASIIHLVNNGALAKNGVIFWDEPEANLNPRAIAHVARLLLALARAGIQIFVATHDYLLVSELSMAAEYQTKEARGVEFGFFSFHRPQAKKPVEVERGEVLADLRHNPIFEEFAEHYERERQLFYAEDEA